MQDALAGLAFNSVALRQNSMDEKASNASEETGQRETASASPGVSDEQLMLAFSKGSAESFDELFRRYKQPVYGFFRRRLADATHAEELTQETFFAVLRNATRYEPRALLDRKSVV